MFLSDNTTGEKPTLGIGEAKPQEPGVGGEGGCYAIFIKSLETAFALPETESNPWKIFPRVLFMVAEKRPQ